MTERIERILPDAPMAIVPEGIMGDLLWGTLGAESDEEDTEAEDFTDEAEAPEVRFYDDEEYACFVRLNYIARLLSEAGAEHTGVVSGVAPYLQLVVKDQLMSVCYEAELAEGEFDEEELAEEDLGDEEREDEEPREEFCLHLRMDILHSRLGLSADAGESFCADYNRIEGKLTKAYCDEELFASYLYEETEPFITFHACIPEIGGMKEEESYLSLIMRFWEEALGETEQVFSNTTEESL